MQVQLVQEQLEATTVLEAENRGKDHDRDTDMDQEDGDGKSSIIADTKDVEEKLAEMDCA